MGIKNLAVAAMAVAVLAACDDNTDIIGGSTTSNADLLNISTDTFDVITKSILCDTMPGTDMYGYLGKIIDPETGDAVTADFSVKFHTLSTLTPYSFYEIDPNVSTYEPSKTTTYKTHTITTSSGSDSTVYDTITTRRVYTAPARGSIIRASQTSLNVFYTSFYGDSLAPMKVTAYEMERTLDENKVYTSNFDPLKEGYIRQNGLKAVKSYTLRDLVVSDSMRTSSGYVPSIYIPLNGEYTSKQGKTYNNIGSYILEKYATSPNDVQNDYLFAKNVLPGIYLKHTNGIGAIARIMAVYMNIYFPVNVKYTVTHSKRFASQNTTYTTQELRNIIFGSSPEVTQHTHISGNGKTQELVNDQTCTYLKTPTGILTEVTLPIEELRQGHEKDSLNSARLTLKRINNTVSSKYTFKAPTYVLMVAKDSLNSFFENKQLPNSTTSYYATYNSTTNGYTFSNISKLISNLQARRKAGDEDWNKVVIVPIDMTINSSTQAITNVSRSFEPLSTRLVGGENNKRDRIELSVIYSRYNQ